MAEIVQLSEGEGLLFTLTDISYSPVSPRMNEPFIVKGKVNLLKIPFVGPIWVIATATYPETWWEEIIPIWGSPEVRATDIALGGDFEITFAKGFQREGEFSLSVRVYAGPTIPIDSVVLPPAPAVATAETTFIVAGEVPPQEELFQDFNIVSYSKNGGTPVTPPGVLELDIGDRCRVNLVYSHEGPAVSGKFHAAIGNYGTFGFDEILFKEQSFSVPQSDDWETYEQSIDIIITSAISPGSGYDLYCKIMGITGGDVLTEYLQNVVTIVGAGEPQLSDLQVVDYDSPVEAGGSCRVKVRFTYQGPAVSQTLYAAIGNYGTFGFDEILKGLKTISIPESQTPTEYEGEVSISITSAIDPAESPYDLYAKVGGIISPVLKSVIYVTGAPAEEEFRNLEITSYDSPLEVGDKCRVRVEFDYRGPAVSKTFYAAIGNYGIFGFDEILKNSKTISISKTDSWQTYSAYVDISITSALDPDDSPYDLYAKINGVTPAVISPVLESVITVVAAIPNPEIRNFKISSYDSQVQIGDYCQVKCSFEYQGPAKSGTLRAAIGNAGTFGFDEIVYDTESISVPETTSWKAYTATARIYISTAISAGIYDLYAKVTGALPDVITPTKYNVITVTKVTVSFKMTIWGIPSDFGSYDYWSCYYYDPGIGGFVSDYKWYSPSSKISFSNVKSGGYLAVILARGSVASDYYYSPSFTAVDGGIYQYDLQLNRISKIG